MLCKRCFFGVVRSIGNTFIEHRKLYLPIFLGKAINTFINAFTDFIDVLSDVLLYQSRKCSQEINMIIKKISLILSHSHKIFFNSIKKISIDLEVAYSNLCN